MTTLLVKTLRCTPESIVFFCVVILDVFYVFVYRDGSECQRAQLELSEAQTETANLRQKVKVHRQCSCYPY